MKLSLRIAIAGLITLVLAALFLFESQKDSEEFSGQLKNGEPHGFGIWEHSSGVYYAGEFQEGKRHGRGTWIHPDGIKYAGEWKYNQYEGRGSLLLPSGARYDGEWQASEKHGQGIYRWPEGKTYTGWWVDDRREGYGILKEPTGFKYEGEWQDGHRHGKGTAYYPGGKEYHGTWLKDLRHGEGTLIFPDGSIYEGQWARDEKHGEGQLTDPDGAVKTGTWVEGRLQEVPVESISIEPDSITLVAGGSATSLDLEVTPEDVTDLEIIWESSDPEIAEVEDGVVRPLQAGSATITATTADQSHTAVCTVTVRTTEVPPGGVRLDRSSITMRSGETAYLIATVWPSDATNLAVSWRSEDSSIAAAYGETRQRGAVRAFEPGTVWITATTADGRHTARCQVTVLPKEDPAKRIRVPRLIGESFQKASEMVNEAGLFVDNVDRVYHDSAPVDQVISQNPAIGATTNQGSGVNLLLSKGPEPEPEVPEEDEEETEEPEDPEDEEPEEEEPEDEPEEDEPEE